MAAEPTRRPPLRPPPSRSAPESAAAEPVAAESVADPDPPPTRAGALTEVIACANRTLAALGRQDRDPNRHRSRPGPGSRPAPPAPPSSGPARSAHQAGRQGGPGARSARNRPGPSSASPFLHQFGVGFIDLAGGRDLVDFGGYAQALVDGRRFGGLSGEPLGPRDEIRPYSFRRDDPLDALRKLQRATAARWACRTIGCAGQPAGWSRPRSARTKSTIWIDGQHVQRFQTVERGSDRYPLATRTETVELWDFGVPVHSLNWPRLPNFRAPR